jgi:hypothetical protein
MSIPNNLKKIKEAFSIEQVNTHLAEGWCLVAITQRAGAMGPAYTLGWMAGGESTKEVAENVRRNASERARGL